LDGRRKTKNEPLAMIKKAAHGISGVVNPRFNRVGRALQNLSDFRFSKIPVSEQDQSGAQFLGQRLDSRLHLGGLFLLLQLFVRQRSKDWHHFQPALALAVSFWQGNIGVAGMAAMAIARQDAPVVDRCVFSCGGGRRRLRHCCDKHHWSLRHYLRQRSWMAAAFLRRNIVEACGERR
jgi:hypothetical protein